jgi:hypothetical protein
VHHFLLASLVRRGSVTQELLHSLPSASLRARLHFELVNERLNAMPVDRLTLRLDMQILSSATAQYGGRFRNATKG